MNESDRSLERKAGPSPGDLHAEPVAGTDMEERMHVQPQDPGSQGSQGPAAQLCHGCDTSREGVYQRPAWTTTGRYVC